MNNQHPYSPGLLYSVEPKDLSTLHLQAGNERDEFDWNQTQEPSLGQKLLDCCRARTARMIGQH
jgi:hypothetical protein